MPDRVPQRNHDYGIETGFAPPSFGVPFENRTSFFYSFPMNRSSNRGRVPPFASVHDAHLLQEKHGKCSDPRNTMHLEHQSRTLRLLVTTKLEVLASLQGQLALGLALDALQAQHDLLGGLGLLVEDGLGLTSVTGLLTVVSALSLGEQRGLASLVLGDLVLGVLAALLALAVGVSGLGNVDLGEPSCQCSSGRAVWTSDRARTVLFFRRGCWSWWAASWSCPASHHPLGPPVVRRRGGGMIRKLFLRGCWCMHPLKGDCYEHTILTTLCGAVRFEVVQC
jgi:hypothetical protein